MGMMNDNADVPELDVTPTKVEKKEETPKAQYIALGAITLNGETVQLLVGVEDHRWYKAKKIGSYRMDERNRSPLVDKFSENIEPFSEEDQKYWDWHPTEKAE